MTWNENWQVAVTAIKLCLDTHDMNVIHCNTNFWYIFDTHDMI